MRYSQFCDVDCDVTLLRIGQNDRFSAAARQHSTQLTKNANAGEAPKFQELRRHSRSSPLTASHAIRPIHTQAVTAMETNSNLQNTLAVVGGDVLLQS